jgi:hypothetical protein
VTARMIGYKIAFALVGLGTIILTTDLSRQLGAVTLGIGVVMLIAPLVWRYLRFCWQLGATIGNELQLAITPLPTPAQIAFQLQAEWGRTPTVQEVAAVQQLLSNRRNEALISSGVALGALYLIDRSVR